MNKKKTVKKVCTFYLSHETYELIENISKTSNLTKSQLIETAWSLYVSACIFLAGTIKHSDIPETPIDEGKEKE